ncbi:MAG TPA: SulP family inorganic anion transporter [Galbitalea sp.]
MQRAKTGTLVLERDDALRLLWVSRLSARRVDGWAMVKILPGLSRHNVVREAVAGVTLLAIAVPLNIGYAQIAGLPATAGLYSLIVPSILFAIFASTRQLVASPDAAAAALVASSLTGLAAAGSKEYIAMALAQAIVGAVLFALCAIFRLGFLANFLSEPILVGFVGGLALDILVSQVAKMLGIHIDSGAEFLEKVAQLFSHLDTLNGWSVLISVLSIAVLLVGQRFARQVPWALIILIVSTLVVSLFDLAAQGVAVLGHVDAGPPNLTWPDLSASQWVSVIPSVFALTIVCMAEGLLVIRKYAQKGEYSTNPNRDLLAFGVANLGAGLTGGFTVGSSTSRTAALDSIGSRTQLPSIVTAAGTLLLVIFGTSLLSQIPSPAIGAIVAVAVTPLVGVPAFARIWRTSRFEFFVGAACFLGCLLLGPIIGIIIAFVLSLLNLALRASTPAIDLLAENDQPNESLLPSEPGTFLAAPGVVIVRFAAPLFFANSEVFDAAIRKAVAGGEPLGLKHLVLDFEAITDIDVTGAKTFAEVTQWLREKQISFDFSRVRPELLALLQNYGLQGDSRVFSSNRAALAALASDASSA